MDCRESLTSSAASRRALLLGSASFAAWAYLPKFARAADGRDPRLIVVILRGGLDGPPRFRRSGIGGGEFKQIAGIDTVSEGRGELRGYIEAQLHAFRRGPGRVGVGETVRPGGRP